MPNRTIYVSDEDSALYQRAQELGGGNLSATILGALRRFVEVEEGRLEGYDEVTVKVGPGGGRKQRFSGVLLAEWGRVNGHRAETFKVYRSRGGKYVIHIDRSADWSMNWQHHLGPGDKSWGVTQGESTLEVVDSLDELRGKVPGELYDMVVASADQPAVEDLDI